MYNSKFTEAARSSIKKNPLKSVIYKANSSSRRIHLQETVGFNQLNFWGKRKEATTGHHTSRCIVRQPRGSGWRPRLGIWFQKIGGAFSSWRRNAAGRKRETETESFSGKGCIKSQSVSSTLLNEHSEGTGQCPFEIPLSQMSLSRHLQGHI